MTEPDAIELFKLSEAKIESVRADINQMVRHDVELQIKMDKLTDRVDNGVAVTGQKTLGIVTDLVSKISEYRVEQNNLKHTMDVHEKLLDRLVTAVFAVAVTGVIGGIVSITWLILKK